MLSTQQTLKQSHAAHSRQVYENIASNLHMQNIDYSLTFIHVIIHHKFMTLALSSPSSPMAT